MAASAARRRPEIHVVDPRGIASASGVEVLDDEPERPNSAGATVSIGADGSVSVEIGTDASADTGPDPKFDANLAERIDDSVLAMLAEHLLEGIEADKQSRRDWEETANRAALYLGIKLEDPSADAADGTICKTIATCLLEAVIKSWSTSRAELLPVGGPVKVRRDDLPTPATGQGGQKTDEDELANALEQDLNWFLTVGDREYYPDFSKMLMSRGLIGVAFRKVHRCPIRRRPASVWVKAQNLIVSNDCTHLSGAGRITEVIRMRQSTMRRMQASGAYLDIPLTSPTGETTDEELAAGEIEGIAASPQLQADFEHLVFECSCEADSFTVPGLDALDRDETGRKPGYPLPYRVSIDNDTRAILEIRRGWKRGDPDHRRRRRYVKYGYLPHPTGGIYDLGLIHVAGNPTLAATMLERSAVDSALFANFPGGVRLGSPMREDKTVIRPGPGEWSAINGSGADDIRKVLMPLPYKPPSPETLALGEGYASKVRDLAGVINIPVGEGRIGNTPVGTMMSYIEGVSQVPGAIHKDDHAAQAEEFELLVELFAEEPEALTRGNKSPGRKAWLAEELTNPDLIPAADPNTPSAVHRLMKLQALVQLGGLPQFNMPAPIADNRAIYEHAMRLLGTGAPGEFTVPPAPPQAGAPQPDPRVVAAGIKAQSQQASDQARLQAAQLNHQGRMAELQAEGQQRDADRASDETRAAMALETAQLHEALGTANAAADRQHQAGIAAAGLIQKHVQHLNELGAQQQVQPQGDDQS